MTQSPVYRTKGEKKRSQISELKIVLKQVMIPGWNSATASIRGKILQIDLKNFTCDYLYKIQEEDGCHYTE